MVRLFVPQDEEREPGAAASEAVQQLLKRQRKRDTAQSFLSAAIMLGLLMVILGLIAIIPWSTSSPTIVTYQAPPQEEEELERPEINQQARPRPPGAKSSRAKVIASTQPSPVAVPIPDNPIPEGPFGMAEEIGEGFGDSEGDGDGGGGASFFGNYRRGKRVAFLVDFSGSMGSTVEGGPGSSRIAALKKELVRSIQNLQQGMQFSVIFFSHHAWTIETPGPNHADNGWNGLGTPPAANYYPATQNIKAKVTAQIEAMPEGGNTNWFSPLRMAFNMNPPPNIVYLLSDGEPRDGDDVLFRLKEINPTGTPIDTIAFELPGSPAGLLLEIAQTTGGRFSMVYKGKLLSGRAAEQFTNPKYD